jgi:hypothetical protein
MNIPRYNNVNQSYNSQNYQDQNQPSNFMYSSDSNEAYMNNMNNQYLNSQQTGSQNQSGQVILGLENAFLSAATVQPLQNSSHQDQYGHNQYNQIPYNQRNQFIGEGPGRTASLPSAIIGTITPISPEQNSQVVPPIPQKMESPRVNVDSNPSPQSQEINPPNFDFFNQYQNVTNPGQDGDYTQQFSSPDDLMYSGEILPSPTMPS